MNSALVTSLRHRLDGLEDAGRNHIVGERDAHAIRVAVARAAPVAPIAPALFLLIALLRPVAAIPAVLVTLAVPAAIFFYVRWEMTRGTVDRLDALGSVDRAFGLKDRAVVTSQLLNASAEDGFYGAAMEEAAPVLERVSGRSLRASPRAALLDRVAVLWFALALVLLILALFVSPASDEVAADGARTNRSMSAKLSRQGQAQDARPTLLASLERRLGLSGRESERSGAGTDGRPGEAGANAAAGSRSAGASGAASAAASSAEAKTGEASGGSASSASEADGAQAAHSGSAATASQESPSDRAAQQSEHGGAPSDSSASATPPSGESQTGTPANRNPGQSGMFPGAAAPQGAQGAAQGAPRSGNGSQGNRRSPGQQGQGGARNSGQGTNGQGGGTAAGQDAAKRSRGVASLLLAVPTEERLSGTPNAGPVRSTTRRVPPHGADADPAAAQFRGSGEGGSGTITHRQTSPQERRLVERYFQRSGSGR